MKKLKIFIVIFIAILSVSCSADLELDAPVATDLPFLSLPDDTDFTNLTDDEKGILITAISRVKIFENTDGLFELKAKSAKEVNISSNLFEYIVKCIQHSNERLLMYSGGKRKTLISRNPTDTSIPSDCAAIAIQYAFGVPYESVDEFLRTECKDYRDGKGVPLEQMEDLLAHYTGGDHNKIKRVSPDYFTSGEMLSNKILIAYDNGGIGHIANGFSVTVDPENSNKKVFITNDHQANEGRIVSESTIYTIFIIND